MLEEIKVAITCIGSGVAQSILNSCRLSQLPLKTFGFGNNPMAFGSFESDERVFVPAIYAEDYPERLLQKCQQHDIDILIPALDLEVDILARHKELFEKEGIKLIISSAEITSLCNDKLKMSSSFGHLNSLFCRSFSKEAAIEAIENNDTEFPLIAKPNSGFASHGVKILNNEKQLRNLESESIIQEIALPVKEDPDYTEIMKQIEKGENPQLSEISFQLVVDSEGKIAGKMVSRNKLQNGVPIEIVPFHNISLWEELDDLINEMIRRGHRGPLNMQGRITPKGLKLFEVNARFTGLTSMRAMMGFNEVESCIKSFGDLALPSTPLQINMSRFSMRQVGDKVVPVERDEKVKKLSSKLSHLNKTAEKKVLITGAGGYLGRNLIRQLAGNKEYSIHALSSDREKISSYFEGLQVKSYSLQDYQQGLLSLGNVDLLIHCAFGRPHYPKNEIASSLEFTSNLFMDAASHQVPEIINISSQSVYGNNSKDKSEQDAVFPETAYAQAKYASELMLHNIKRFSPHTNYTSLRFASLSGGQPGFVENDILSKFMLQVIEGNRIIIKGKDILIERLDVRDAVSAIISLLKIDSSYWKDTYNVGSGEHFPLGEIAGLTNKMISEKMNIPAVDIEYSNEDIRLIQRLDSSSFRNDTGWKSEYRLEDTLLSLIDYYKEKAII